MVRWILPVQESGNRGVGNREMGKLGSGIGHRESGKLGSRVQTQALRPRITSAERSRLCVHSDGHVSVEGAGQATLFSTHTHGFCTCIERPVRGLYNRRCRARARPSLGEDVMLSCTVGMGPGLRLRTRILGFVVRGSAVDEHTASQRSALIQPSTRGPMLTPPPSPRRPVLALPPSPRGSMLTLKPYTVTLAPRTLTPPVLALTIHANTLALTLGPGSGLGPR